MYVSYQSRPFCRCWRFRPTSTRLVRSGMLDVLESAQAAGQKTQLDAQISSLEREEVGGPVGGDHLPAGPASGT